MRHLQLSLVPLLEISDATVGDLKVEPIKFDHRFLRLLVDDKNIIPYSIKLSNLPTYRLSIDSTDSKYLELKFFFPRSLKRINKFTGMSKELALKSEIGNPRKSNSRRTERTGYYFSTTRCTAFLLFLKLESLVYEEYNS